MIGGLFLNTLSFVIVSNHVVNNTANVHHIQQEHVIVQQTQIVSARTQNYYPEFSIAVLFVSFLALYRSTNFKTCVGILMFKIVSMTLIGPMLTAYGYYIDGIVTTTVLALRFIYLSYFWYVNNRFEFVLYNTTTLMFVHGRAAPFMRSSHSSIYVTLYGGINYMFVNDLTLHFVDPMLVSIAIRGLAHADLTVVRAVELLNGDFIYVFSQEPVVGVYNAAFSQAVLNEIDLKEEVEDHVYDVPSGINCHR
uniref:Non-structural protein 3b n=1 Tax=Canine coronavirus (strain BGF10) TaxID=441619 RepID=NS3B_CVCBG|nr:RecName: Full=Non-structural protein 3b; Short=ns3b; AltName: Full=Accessory protein 3b; AltName: Full=Protein X2 [Canine coronavirus BGF10]AAQ17222.1 non-structural protein 3b [Canine coronavirus]